MAKYQKQVSMGGAWVKASEIQSGTRAKLVSETVPQPSQFLDKNGVAKTQDVAKIRFEGGSEPLNISLNRATINALVDAFGEDSANWQGHTLTSETEKVKVAGKTVFALYLLPEGYVKTDDANGYTVIVKKGNEPTPEQAGEGTINVEDIPF